MKHFKNQTGIAQVEMNRLLQGRRQRKLLDLERRQVGSKTNAVEFVPIAGVRHDGLQFNLEGLAIAQRGQLDRPAVALLQKGEHGIDGVKRQPIDGKNLVARLQAGLGCRHPGLDLANADRVFLHPGHETDGVKVEVVAPREVAESSTGC